MYNKIFQSLLRRFFRVQGREPLTPNEWDTIRKEAREIVKQRKKTAPFDEFKPKVVDLFASEKEFASDLYSMNQNFIKNDPMFNLELATKLRNPGVKTYGWTPSGDKSKLLSPKQRQTALDELKGIMKHDTYQAQFAEDFLLEDGSLFKLTDDMFTIEKAEGGRIGMAGGGVLKKFIERLFIKASNDIRQGKGKWKGLDQKQRIVQHDNLTKKVVEFQKSGNTVGLEEYFGVDPHTAFIAARDKAKRLGIKKDFKKQEVKAQQYADEIDAEMWDASRDAVDSLTGEKELTKRLKMGQKDAMKERIIRDERTMLKQKYPGLTDDLLDKILIDDNPQRKAEVLATMDEYLTLRKAGKGENEAYEIMVKSIKDPTRHAEGGRADFIFGGSSGLKAMWKQMLKGLSKGRDKPVKRLFPKPTIDESEILEQSKRVFPEKYKAFTEGEAAHKLEGIDILINRLKQDKKIIERQAKNKAIKDPGLNFLMKHLEETAMPEVYGPHLKKYTNIDKDILQLENIKKNLVMKDRKLHQSGGLAYMLGEPTYMKYDGGGSVGHAPWLKPSGQQPQGQPQPQGGGRPGPGPQGGGRPGPGPQGGGQAPGAGRPDPMKAPRGLPSLAPRTMDPAFMQQQAMQRMMMGQQGQQGQPRRGMAEGKKAKKKEIPEELPPYQGPDYETDDPKEAVKKIINLIIGSGPEGEGVMGVPIGGGFKYGVGIGEDKPFDYGIGWDAGPEGGLYADYGIRADDENVYSGGYHGDDWGIGVRKEEGGDPYFTFKKKFNQGGRVPMMYGGDPGFAFEYGGSWADWRDRHQHQMPVTDYIKTKLPKERLPFRDMQSGGRIGLKKGSTRDRLQKDWKSYSKLIDLLYTAPPILQDKPGSYMPSRDVEQTRLKERFMYGDLDKAEGGIMRIPFGLGSMSRRAFMKLMAAGAALPFIGKGISKVAPKAIPKVTETIVRGADGMPTYITDLITVVKAKGAKDFIEGFKKSDYSTVHRYKGVEVIEEAGGTTRIKKSTEGVAEDASTGKMQEGTSKEIEMEISPQYREQYDPDSGVSWFEDLDGRKHYETKIPDEYFEGTVRPDAEGKMKDIIEEIDEVDHLELKKIADEVDTLIIKKSKKASGGLAYALGE